MYRPPVGQSWPPADLDSVLEPLPAWSGHERRHPLWHRPWRGGTSRSRGPYPLDWHSPAPDTEWLRHTLLYGIEPSPECRNTQDPRGPARRLSEHISALHPACCRIPPKGKPDCSRLRRYWDWLGSLFGKGRWPHCGRPAFLP